MKARNILTLKFALDCNRIKGKDSFLYYEDNFTALCYKILVFLFFNYLQVEATLKNTEVSKVNKYLLGVTQNCFFLSRKKKYKQSKINCVHGK